MLYSVHAVILGRYEIKDRESSYSILTLEYGKIQAFYKEPKAKGPIDIGVHVSILLDTKGSINRIQSIDHTASLRFDLLNYETVHRYLLILEWVRWHFPDGGGEWFFNDLSEVSARSHWALDVSSSKEYTSHIGHILFILELRLLAHFQGITQYAQTSLPILAKLATLAENNTLLSLRKIQGIPDAARERIHELFLQYFF